MPSSSIVTSPTPVSCTMRTTSRIRSARARSNAVSRFSTPVGAAADRPQQPFRLLAEQPEQQQLLLARREPLRLRAQLVERGHAEIAASRDRPCARRRGGCPRRSRPAACPSSARKARASRRRRSSSGSQRGRSAAPGSRGSGRSAPRAAASRPRRGSRTTSASTSSSRSPADCARRFASSAATRPAGRSCSAARTAIARRERRHRLVADVLVDQIRRLPELLHVDTRTSRPRPASASARLSPETRCSVSATG